MSSSRSLALMDMADHARVFGAVRRVLKPGGAFLFSVLHPCFEGTPFHAEREPRYVVDGDGTPTAFAVCRYATEGYRKSVETACAGRVAPATACSSYVNDLVEAGFAIERLASRSSRAAGLFAEVPTVLLVLASRGVRHGRRLDRRGRGSRASETPLVEPLSTERTA